MALCQKKVLGSREASRGMWRALSGCYWGALGRGRDEGCYVQRVTLLAGWKADFRKPERKAGGPVALGGDSGASGK